MEAPRQSTYFEIPERISISPLSITCVGSTILSIRDRQRTRPSGFTGNLAVMCLDGSTRMVGNPTHIRGVRFSP